MIESQLWGAIIIAMLAMLIVMIGTIVFNPGNN